VIGSETVLQTDGVPIRGRQYDWGIAEGNNSLRDLLTWSYNLLSFCSFTFQVENEKHCDFVHLRELLLIRCLAELVDITHNKHYHDYRASILRRDGRPPSILECDEEYDLRIEKARKSIAERLQRKDEEIRQNFVQLARQQELALRKQEEEVSGREPTDPLIETIDSPFHYAVAEKV
jgi:septin family protein